MKEIVARMFLKEDFDENYDDDMEGEHIERSVRRRLEKILEGVTRMKEY